MVVLTTFGIANGVEAETETSVSKENIAVCVDWDSKEVRYSKYWEECPSRHAQILLGTQGPKGEKGDRGPRGYGGSSTSMWDSLSSCNQKLEAALKSGLVVASRSDREFFERASGCLVEESALGEENRIFERAGMAFIKSYELVDMVSKEGDGMLWAYYNGGLATYDIEIGNHLAISSIGSSYSYCVVDRSGSIENLGEGKYRAKVRFYAKPESLKSDLVIGYRQNNYSECIKAEAGVNDGAFDTFLGSVTIHEDPLSYKEFVGANDLTVAWGW